jgi:hypothetical protein
VKERKGKRNDGTEEKGGEQMKINEGDKCRTYAHGFAIRIYVLMHMYIYSMSICMHM